MTRAIVIMERGHEKDILKGTKITEWGICAQRWTVNGMANGHRCDVNYGTCQKWKVRPRWSRENTMLYITINTHLKLNGIHSFLRFAYTYLPDIPNAIFDKSVLVLSS